jgi:hypothetical protein
MLGLGTDGNIMSDIMNLVDFYVENDIVQRKVVGTKKVEKQKDEEGGEGTVVSEDEPIYESTYPITALGMGCIDEKVAELCYRQFVVSSFTDRSPSVPRYEASKSTFGGILGLTKEKMDEIGSNIGSMVYDNYISQSMSTKGALDQLDMMFLANIQGKLGISAEQGERMLLDTQKKIISEEASALFDYGAATPEQVKEFREKCNSMGLDLEADVGLTKSRLVSMFSMEITPGIDSGEICGVEVSFTTEDTHVMIPLSVYSNEFFALCDQVNENVAKETEANLLGTKGSNTLKNGGVEGSFVSSDKLNIITLAVISN